MIKIKRLHKRTSNNQSDKKQPKQKQISNSQPNVANKLNQKINISIWEFIIALTIVMVLAVQQIQTEIERQLSSLENDPPVVLLQLQTNKKQLINNTLSNTQSIQSTTIKSIKTPNRYSHIIQNITQAEIDLLAKVTLLEAGGESNEGQQAVTEVIFNRVLSNRFPNTITEVIYAPAQFAVVPMLNKAIATNKEYNNINQVLLENRNFILDDDVVYFSGLPQNNKVYQKIGNHYFCRV